eukprot:765489-Hanusia_phi.AAC.12
MYKGGVYKSSTTINAAAALAKSGKKVAIIDADGQCNITTFFYPAPDSFEKELDMLNEEGKKKAQQEREKSRRMDRTIRLSKCSNVALSDRSCTYPREELIQPLTPCCFELNTWLTLSDDDDGSETFDRFDTIYDVLYPAFDQLKMPCPKLLPIDKYDNNLFLLPGSTEIHRLEAMISSNQPREYGPMFLAFKQLYDLIGQKYNLDFIFVDLGPNHHELNMGIVLSCDYILPPIHADFYSASSVYRMLHVLLPFWNEWRKKFVSDCESKLIDVPNVPVQFKTLPRMLPFLVQGYKLPFIRRRTQINKIFTNFIASISLIVQDQQIPQVVKTLFIEDTKTMVVPFCPALPVGTRVSHELGVPLIHIDKYDLSNFYGPNDKRTMHQFEKIRPEATLAECRFGSLNLNPNTRKNLSRYLTNLQGKGKPVQEAEEFETETDDSDVDGSIECNQDDQDPENLWGSLREASLNVAQCSADLNDKDSSYKSIAVFNYKGGVGKTSVVISLAATLAKDGKRVCIIDGDGQCNATSFFHPDLTPFEINFPSEGLMRSSKLLSDSVGNDLKALNPKVFDFKNWLVSDKDIYDAMHPVLEGKLEDIRCPELLSVRSSQEGDIYQGRLMLLPGSSNLSRVKLSSSLPQRDIRNYGILRKIFDMMAKKYNLDFIFVDLGPSVGEINKAFVMSCDFLLPPAHPDFFSASSVKGLLQDILPNWLAWRLEHREKWKKLDSKARSSIEEFQFYDFSKIPRILPFIVHGYELDRHKDTNEVELSHANFLKCIEYLVEDDRVPAEVKELYVRDRDGLMVVPFCCALQFLPNISHQTGIPLVHLADHRLVQENLKQAKTRSAKGWNASTEAKMVSERFESLAKFIIAVASKSDETGTNGARGAATSRRYSTRRKVNHREESSSAKRTREN